MRFFDNIKTRNKIVSVFLLFCTMLIVVGVIGFLSTQNVDNSLNLMYDEQLIPLTNIGTINTLFGNIRGDLYRYLVVEAEKAKTKETMDGRITQIHELVDGFTSGEMSVEEEKTLSQLNLALTDFEKALATYESDIDTGNTAKAIEALGTGGRCAYHAPGGHSPIGCAFSKSCRRS